MIVPQTDLDVMLTRKHREGVFRLPVRHSKGAKPKHPKTGRVLAVPASTELTAEVRRNCPVRRGGVYTLTATKPLARYRHLSEREPTRARAVLGYIDRVHGKMPTLVVTVLEHPTIEHVNGQDVWMVRYRKGTHRGLFDRSVYLAKTNEYTTSASRQAVPGDPELEILKGDGERARVMEIAQRARDDEAMLESVKATVGELQRSLKAMKYRNRLRLIAKEVEKLAVEVSADTAATLPASDRAESEAPAAANGEPPPNSTESPVPLESAA